MQALTWGQYFFFPCSLWDSSDASCVGQTVREASRLQQSWRRNNHSQSKFICFAITVHFREGCPTSRLWNAPLYILINGALRSFFCLLKNLSSICMEIYRRPMHMQEYPNRKSREEKEGNPKHRFKSWHWTVDELYCLKLKQSIKLYPNKTQHLVTQSPGD